MTQYNMYEAKTKLSEIVKRVQERKDDYVIISRNGIPAVKVVPIDNRSRSGLFGCAEGMFEIPDNFDDMDIVSDFEEEIL